LLAADIGVRGEAEIPYHETALLPPYRHVIVDEAHAFEQAVRRQFGARTSELAIARTLGQLARTGKRGGSAEKLRRKLADRAAMLPAPLVQSATVRLTEAVAALADQRPAVEAWFAALDRWLSTNRREQAVAIPREAAFAPVTEQGQALADTLERIARSFCLLWGESGPDELPTDVAGVWSELRSRADRLAVHARVLRAALGPAGHQEVAWLERRGRRRKWGVELAPIDVGPLLASRLWAQIHAAVLTSATLDAGDEFAMLRQRLGLDLVAVHCRREPSPFAYARLMHIGCMRGVAVTTPNAWSRDAAVATALAVEASRGRALVLCTSHTAVRQLTAALRVRRLPYPIYAQGERPIGALVEAFRHECDSVLVGTASFWEGVDVPGASLSHLIVTKLPFAVPTHPLEVARHDWVKARGEDPFRRISLPEAVMRFRQGVGRLIRSETDCGAVTVLDDRLQTRGYGSRFRAALPAPIRVFGPPETVAAQTAAWLQVPPAADAPST